MTASEDIQCFLMNVRLLLKGYLKKPGNLLRKNVLLKDINIKKKMCNCFLELRPHNKYFEMKTDQNKKNDGNVFTSETRCFHVFLVELL